MHNFQSDVAVSGKTPRFARRGDDRSARGRSRPVRSGSAPQVRGLPGGDPQASLAPGFPKADAGSRAQLRRGRRDLPGGRRGEGCRHGETILRTPEVVRVAARAASASWRVRHPPKHRRSRAARPQAGARQRRGAWFFLAAVASTPPPPQSRDPMPWCGLPGACRRRRQRPATMDICSSGRAIVLCWRDQIKTRVRQSWIQRHEEHSSARGSERADAVGTGNGLAARQMFDATVEGVALRPGIRRDRGAGPDRRRHHSAGRLERDRVLFAACARPSTRLPPPIRRESNSARFRWRGGSAIEDGALGSLARVYDVTVLSRPGNRGARMTRAGGGAVRQRPTPC